MLTQKLKRWGLMFLFVAAVLLALPFGAFAADFTRDQRDQIEQIIHDYIMENPRVLVDAVNEFGQEQKAANDEEASKKIIENYDWLTKNKHHAEAGNPKGDVTIVEFFDYNCGYCKQALSDLMTLLDEDKGVRLVFVEIPILGESSAEVARWALASLKQDLYLPYHIALMRHKGMYDESVLADFAKKAGLDVAKLKKDKNNPAFDAQMNENNAMATKLGIVGTPAFVVGKQLVRGYVGLDGMRQAVAAARAAK